MKKSKILVFLWVLCGMNFAKAVSDFKIAGELDVTTIVNNLPTRNQGQVAFSIPSFQLNMAGALSEGNTFYGQLESAENRDATSKRMNTELRHAFLSLSSFLPAGSEIRYGLIPDQWLDLEKKQWEYDFWNGYANLPMERFKYTAWSDMGLTYQSVFPDPWGFWAVNVSNGEGLESDEIGPRKFATLILAIKKAAPFYVLFSYGQGAYDAYGSEFNQKIRLQAHFSYEVEKGLVALEYYETKDPADVIDGRAADAVNVSAYLGQSISGRGAAIFGKYKLDEKWALFARGDWLNPVTLDASKKLQSWQGGASYYAAENITLALAYDSTQYSEFYSTSAADTSRLVFAAKAVF